MKLSELKQLLTGIESVNFQLPTGVGVPIHYHITEVGQIDKRFIDCGGTIRKESSVSIQLWESVDFEHRLAPAKFLRILELSESKLGIEDLPIEVEYQSDTIGKYGLDFDGETFLLTSQTTACLASDSCGIPQEKVKKNLKELTPVTACCGTEGGCC